MLGQSSAQSLGCFYFFNRIIESIEVELLGFSIFQKKRQIYRFKYFLFVYFSFLILPFHYPVAKDFHDVINALFEVNFTVIACCQWHFQTCSTGYV